jgi:3-hydroxyacyl-CoA dehydrogenase
MLFDYAREAIELAEEGIPPERIDRAMKTFGMAMGPFAMFDLSGLDVFWHIQQGNPDAMRSRSAIVDRLYREKRFGQKSGAGIYRYEKGSREPIPDPVTLELFREEAAKAGIPQGTVVSDAEIAGRLAGALATAGAELLRTGVALRSGDIDIVYVYGYGFPPHLGGPMWYAEHHSSVKELVHA